MTFHTSETILATHHIRGREFQVIALTWPNTDDLSYDVHDAATGICLSAESWDSAPTSDDIRDTLAELTAESPDFDAPFHQQTEGLVELLAALTPSFEVGYRVVASDGTQVGDEGSVIVDAATPEEAASIAATWALDHDADADPRIDPRIDVQQVEAV